MTRALRRASILAAGAAVAGTALLANTIRRSRAEHLSRPRTLAAAPRVTALPSAAAERHGRRRAVAATPATLPPVVAQPTAEPPARTAAPMLDRPAESRTWPARSRSEAPVTLPSAVTPHSVEVITVGVPRDIPAEDTVPWRVLPTPQAEILSAREGTLLPAPADSGRNVVVVARVPAAAPAGPTHVATAQFGGPEATISVDVNLLVTRIRRAEVRLIRSALAVRPTDRADLTALVANRGNAVDTITVDATLPPGWRLKAPPRTLILRPGQQQTVHLSADVPRDAQPQHTYAVLTARAAGTALADATADVDILDRRDGADRGGPMLTAGMASSVGDSTVSSPVVSLDVAGHYSQNTTVSGRAAFTADRANANIQAVGRVGVYLGQAYLSLANPHWQATVGGTGRQFTPTTGLNAYGVGVSGSVGRDGWSAGVMAAQPTGGLSGQLLGAQVGHELGGGNLSVSGTDFRESGIYSRALEAAGVDYTSAPIYDTRISGGLAWRTFTGGSGMGWSVGANRSTANDYLSILAVHTPGGSQAYSQATDQVSVAAMRRISDRVALHAAYAKSSDQNVTFSDLANRSVSAGSDIKLAPSRTLDLDLSSNRFDAASTGLGFGSRDVTARANLSTQVRKFTTDLTLTAGQVQRMTTLGALSVEGPAATRVGAAAAVGWLSARGRFTVTSEYDYSGPGAGFYPQALQVGVAASGIVLSGNPKVPTVDASVQRYEWFGSRPGATVARVGTAVQVGDGYRLLVDVERNPFLRANASSGTPVVAAFKIERSFGLPMLHQNVSAQGVVYEDLNGNGVRDRGEPALAGVMVRRGGEVTTSDEKGRFDLFRNDARPASIDATSLPLGMVPGAVTSENHALVMGVMPTAAVDVTLTPVEDELGRKPVTTDLAPAVIVATDSVGTAWTIQADSLGHARLDALPPGRYTISADFSGFEERLRVIGPAPVVNVQAGVPVPPVRLPFGLVGVKMFNARNGNAMPLAKEPK